MKIRILLVLLVAAISVGAGGASPHPLEPVCAMITITTLDPTPHAATCMDGVAP